MWRRNVSFRYSFNSFRGGWIKLSNLLFKYALIRASLMIWVQCRIFRGNNFKIDNSRKTQERTYFKLFVRLKFILRMFCNMFSAFPVMDEIFLEEQKDRSEKGEIWHKFFFLFFFFVCKFVSEDSRWILEYRWKWKIQGTHPFPHTLARSLELSTLRWHISEKRIKGKLSF